MPVTPRERPTLPQYIVISLVPVNRDTLLSHNLNLRFGSLRVYHFFSPGRDIVRLMMCLSVFELRMRFGSAGAM
jgi:hypothetical protein